MNTEELPSLYDRTGDIKDLNTVLVQRDKMRALEAENAALKADAERYRWLRDVSVPPHNFYLSVPHEFHDVRYTKEQVNQYIDAARSKT